MKDYRSLFLTLICSAVISLSLFSHSVLRAEPLLMVSGYWTPYVDKSLPNGGGLTELVQAVTDKMDRQLQVLWFPWSRGEEYIANGLYFATFPYAKNTRREQMFHFSDPLYFVETSFFYDKRQIQGVEFEDLDDLVSYRIGGVRGYGYIDRLKRANLDLYLVNHADQLVDMLGRGRVDLIAVNKRSGQRMLAEKFPDRAADFQVLERPLNKRHGVHLMISRRFENYRQLTEQFNRALKALKASGEYEAILRRNNL
ncbi:MAG: substrate-binding periplasmic protein [Pseudomonadales bacterium]